MGALIGGRVGEQEQGEADEQGEKQGERERAEGSSL
jgi:hypothetical protein